ncbi:putative spore germination protein GerPD [Paenibacillus sp. J31TS4]|uniref:spore gernimation protein GerPD n=1 Tax=Paenibacillus sp. J31TS4 TaxID=2807195 RepID=UPI001B23DC70|nr:spore gernimation protein GerPD [Paenibacillus sp. J31TS4]GIP38119.1 putative spore germination protein GerPD [Paenibacillus sp. J31TS4]
MSVNMHVVNEGTQVGMIKIYGVGGSSVAIVGDAEVISLSSAFDTPPESCLTGPFQLLPPEP